MNLQRRSKVRTRLRYVCGESVNVDRAAKSQGAFAEMGMGRSPRGPALSADHSSANRPKIEKD
jgi:hypothetical protein